MSNLRSDMSGVWSRLDMSSLGSDMSDHQKL
jgi:hypothetical protein